MFRVVEQTGPRVFGLDDAEVQTRRRYVRDVRRELEVRLLYPLLHPYICTRLVGMWRTHAYATCIRQGLEHARGGGFFSSELPSLCYNIVWTGI